MPADVVVIGGGPAGLAAAIELRRLGVNDVVVLEREARAGGIPRHASHIGFGIRDLRRCMTGPRYAEHYRRLAMSSGVRLREEAQATGWASGGTVEVTSPQGREELSARAFLLATGCRERPRSARMVGGTRPANVMTTGELQQRVHLYGGRLGDSAIVVGAEHVSFSAIDTLHRAGARARALVTEHPRHQSLDAFRIGARLRYGTRVLTRTRVRSIEGAERVEAVALESLASGRISTVECGCVVFSADWVADSELASQAGCQVLRPGLSPRVTADGRTSSPGVWCAGNLVHPAETADVAALGGRHVGAAIAKALRHHDVDAASASIDVDVASPLRWSAPSSLRRDRVAGRPSGDRFLLRSDLFVRHPAITVGQDGTQLWRGRLLRLIPGRSASIPAAWLARVEPAGGPVSITVSGSGFDE